MENNNNKKPKQPQRNIISILLPYILLGLIIFGFGYVMFNAFNNKVTYWNFNQLDEILGDGSIKTAYVSEKTNTTVITGIYREGQTNKEYKYSVSMPNSSFDEEFVVSESNIYTHSEGDLIYHLSYKVVFEKEINEYKNLDGIRDSDRNAAKMTIEDAFEVSWWQAWGPTIVTTGITILIAIFLFSRLTSSINSSNNTAIMFNKSRARRVDASKVRFSDVAGCEEEKAEMVELVEYLKDPKKFTKFGAKLPKGILLVGNPGTGKTLLAKAVAGEAGVPFFSISGSDFVEMFVGVGAGRVRDMFKTAKQNAPCMIFIDEIDAVGRQRGAGLGGGNDEREQTLNQLLVEMDGFEDNSGIIVIAATNRADVLDPALLRSGRFDRTITVSLPDKAGREAILKVHARNKIVDENVNFEAIAKRTVGFSGADLENILNEAAVLAVRSNKEKITTEDIDEAIDRRIAGPAKKSRSMSVLERKMVAYHEAGHAIIGLKLKESDKVQKITIVSRGNTGGHVLMTPEDDRFLLTKGELEARIVGYLGGRSSEEIFFNDITTGASNDIEVATRIARLMVTEYGMSALGPIQYERDTGSVFLGRDYTSTQKNFSTQIAFEIDQEVRKIIDSAHEKAKEIITTYKDEVIKIAETLLEKETITAEEIDSLLGTKKVETSTEVKETKPKAPRKPKAKKEDNE